MRKSRKKLVAVRLPPHLWERVKALAFLNDRSYTDEVVAALEKHVHRRKEEAVYGEKGKNTVEDERRPVENDTRSVGA